MNVKHYVSHLFPLSIFITLLVVFSHRLSLETGILFTVGFFAQLIDGAIGLGFGMVSTTALLVFDMNPALLSNSVHTAEIFSSAASGISHYRNRNLDKKIFLSLLLPGVIGAFVGSIAMIFINNFNVNIFKIIIAVYTLILGGRLIYLFFRQKCNRRQNSTKTKISNIKLLALFGGFFDSFGGGWGPIVTSTLIQNGRKPRYVIGSVNSAEFFVALTSSATLFVALGVKNWSVIIPLVCGGVVAAPIAAKTTKRVSSDNILLPIGLLVIMWSFYVIVRTIL